MIDTDLNSSLEIINDDNFGLSTDFIISTLLDDHTFELFDIYNIGKSKGGELKINFVGTWNYNLGINFTMDIDKKLRWNLNGMKLKTRGIVCILFLKYIFL